jgi:glycosyltransferase involved in cell wall biosynthesis
MKLITLSRISREKGFERMVKLANLIPIPYTWDIYGTATSNYAKSLIPQFPESVNFKGFDQNAKDYIKDYDYLVQLSDTEGCPYVILEALQAKTPVITTNYPSAKELVKQGKNGWILDMQLSNWKIILRDKIKITTFNPKSTEKDWINFLENDN